MSQTPMLHSLLAIALKLSEGDRARVLQFAQNILEERQAKRQQRRSRFHQQEVTGWRVGE